MSDLDNKPPLHEPRVTSSSSARAQQICDLLTQHGIPARRQRSFLSDVLGSSYANTRRRLLGEIPFSTDELDLIAHHLGLRLTFQFTPLAKEPAPIAQLDHPSAQAKRLPAKIEIQGLDLDCLVEESPKPTIPLAADSLGLHRGDAGAGSAVYRVVRSTATPAQHTLTALAAITILPVYARSGPELAIIDASPDEGEHLMRCLSTAGFRTELYAAPADLTPRSTRLAAGATETTRVFDAYLIDFNAEQADDIESMIEAVRKDHPHAAVILMSDKLGDDMVTEAAERLIRAHGVSLVPKPSPTFAIVAQLRREIERLRQKDQKREEAPKAMV